MEERGLRDGEREGGARGERRGREEGGVKRSLWQLILLDVMVRRGIK